MDPNQALADLRAAIKDADRYADSDPAKHLDALLTVADRAEALDGWLSAGAFLPDAWRKP